VADDLAYSTGDFVYATDDLAYTTDVVILLTFSLSLSLSLCVCVFFRKTVPGCYVVVIEVDKHCGNFPCSCAGGVGSCWKVGMVA